jgi:hypothetical protein
MKLAVSLALLLTGATQQPAFDLEVFRLRAGSFRYEILMRPTCVAHQGVRGSFLMDTPQQDGLPFSVSTIVTAGAIVSNITTSVDGDLSEAVATEVGGVFNDIAEALIRQMIADCKTVEL